MRPVSALAATGILGAGFRPESIRSAIELGIDYIGCDAGTTDFGPHALATGISQFSPAAVRRDLEILLVSAVTARIPLLIGSAGTAGGDRNVDWLLTILDEVALEHSLHFRQATIRSELSQATLRELVAAGATAPLPPSVPLSIRDAEESISTVAMMGVEPIQAALEGGAEVVVCGRSSDSALFAAYPLLHGSPAAASWHAAKILECGAAAVTQRKAADSIRAVIREDDSFDVEPLRADYRCTPQSVASHTLYENADPFRLAEPSGILDTSASTYTAISDRAVRVSGSRFEPTSRYSVKLEGARLCGYSTVVLGGVRDPYVLAQLDSWLAQLDRSLGERLAGTLGDQTGHRVTTRVYGRDAVMGSFEPSRAVTGHEVAIVWDVVADSQTLAHSIATSLSHMALHNPIPEWDGLISALAFPFAPPELDRGAVYEFNLNHVAFPASPTALFRTEWREV